MATYDKYTSAVCDVLGFSRAVEKVPLDAIVDHGISWLFKVLHHVIHGGSSFPEYTPSLKDLQSQERLGVAVFSDTVLLYTLNDDDCCLQSLLLSIAGLLFETISSPSPRIRCGVAYGEAYLDSANSVYIGQPIVEAHRLEALQQWSGAALTAAAVERIPKGCRSGQFKDWPVIPYDVPIKGREPYRTLALNWPLVGFHRPGEFDLPWSKDSDEPTHADWIAEREICEKWYFTKRFHDQVCRCSLHGPSEAPRL